MKNIFCEIKVLALIILSLFVTNSAYSFTQEVGKEVAIKDVETKNAATVGNIAQDTTVKPAAKQDTATKEIKNRYEVGALVGVTRITFAGVKEMAYTYGAELNYKAGEKLSYGLGVAYSAAYAHLYTEDLPNSYTKLGLGSTVLNSINKNEVFHSFSIMPNVRLNYPFCYIGLISPINYFSRAENTFVDYKDANLKYAIPELSGVSLSAGGLIGFQLRIYETFTFFFDFSLEKTLISSKKDFDGSNQINAWARGYWGLKFSF